jgi:hypothetical protein
MLFINASYFVHFLVIEVFLSCLFFSAAENFSLVISDSQWLLSNVISLSELNLAENGYIKDDAIIMEVEISNISMV